MKLTIEINCDKEHCIIPGTYGCRFQSYNGTAMYCTLFYKNLESCGRGTNAKRLPECIAACKAQEAK